MSRQRVAIVLPLVLLAVAAFVAVSYRSTYGIWPLSSASPDRVHWCGRDFSRTGAPVAEPEQAATIPGTSVVRAGRYPRWGERRDLLIVRPQPDYRKPDLPCTIQVLLQRPDGAYDSFGLMGGP